MLPPTFAYVPGFLSEAEQRELLAFVHGLEFEHRAYGPRARAGARESTMARGYAQFGHAYEADGRKRAEAPAIPERLLLLRDRAVQALAIPASFEMCAVMSYPTGSELGWHVDGRRFGEHVLAISLGGPTHMQFRRLGESAILADFLLESGSAYAFWGQARWDCEHRVTPVEAQRHAITFRQALDV